MKSIFLLLFIFLCNSVVWAQSSLRAVIKDNETKEPIIGATVFIPDTDIGATSDQTGLVQLTNIPDGKHVVVFRFIGYEEVTDTFSFPILQPQPLEILLIPREEEIEEVVVTSTRTSRTIADIPTRIEAISGEEIEEKANMKPGDIRMMLNESTGIQTQQTSATSYNSSIRIQGLDGKYTQILRDGYPLYSGFSGGLSLLQIVPLDLKQVEVIKGASSTLYGGGAIAGLVNLISRVPGENRELNFMVNGTSALGLDVSGFYSQKYGKTGAIVFASYNAGTPYDPSNIGLTAIPEFKRYTFNPKLYIYPNTNTTLSIGINSTIEDRIGGDIKYIEDDAGIQHSYFEKNETQRISSQLGLDHRINENSGLSIKNSLSYYNRIMEIPGFKFSGIQLSSFTEAAYAVKGGNMEWVVGLNAWTDQFEQDKFDTTRVVDYNHTTLGTFVQNTWNVSEAFSLEAGLRGDYQDQYGFFVLPRVSALIKVNPDLSFRLGGGLGYKTPTVFNEDAERIQFKNVLPIDASKTLAEESLGGNLDINYRTPISGQLNFSINTLLFYTRINHPLVLTPLTGGIYEFQQPNGYIDTKGIEVNAKLTYNQFKLFIGYTLADVNQNLNDQSTQLPLVARHRLNNVLMYEIEEKLKIGLEAYYFSKQKLNDGTTGKPYWICGFMAEKLWENFSIFVNLENILDTRQTKFGSIYTGTITNPVFRDIYAPLDGFVVNAGIKLKL